MLKSDSKRFQDSTWAKKDRHHFAPGTSNLRFDRESACASTPYPKARCILYWIGLDCEQMLKIRDGPGVWDPQEDQKSGFSGQKPAGDPAPTCPDHMVSFSARKTDIQPSSLTMFIWVSKKIKQIMKIKLFGYPLNPRALGTFPA